MWSNAIFFGWASLVAVAFTVPKSESWAFNVLRIILLGGCLAGLWFCYEFYTNASWRDMPGLFGQIAVSSGFSVLLLLWLKAALPGVKSGQGEKVLAAQEARFKLLTLSIACVAAARIFMPYLDTWAKRTSGLEVGVFKLALFEPRKSGKDLELTALGGRDIGDEATRASGALDKVIGLGVGGDEDNGAIQPTLDAALDDATQSRRSYASEPMIIRDFMITRFLAAQGDASKFNIHPNPAGDADSDLFDRNFKFARNLAIPLQCVDAAAKLTRDYRLVMLDVHPLIRWMMRLSVWDPEDVVAPRGEPGTNNNQGIKSDAGWPNLLKTSRSIYNDFMDPSDDNSKEVAKACPDVDPAVMYRQLRELSGNLEQSHTKSPVEANAIALRKGPYPTMAAAWLLGGIGGTEAAMSILTRWLTLHPVYTGKAAVTPTDIWMYSRGLGELDLLVPNDLVDAGNEELNGLYDKMHSSLKKVLPELFKWYSQPACALVPQIPAADRTYREIEQAFYQSFATIRLRAYRSKIGLSKAGSRIITDDVIDEAKKLADARHDCFPLVPKYQEQKELYLGQQAAYVGYLQKAYVESRIRSEVTDDQNARLKEARAYFRRAQDLLEQYEEYEHGQNKPGNNPGKHLTQVERLGPSLAENRLLSGAGAAGPELVRIRRALIAIDQLIGEE